MQIRDPLAIVLAQAVFYQGIERDGKIENPTKVIPLGTNVCISNQAIKHIVEQRGKHAKEMLSAIPYVLSNPTKIADNSSKRPESLIYAQMNGHAKAVVLEKTKTPDGSHQVVSVFPMDKKTYRKLVDISGGPDVPSLDIA